MASCCLYSTEFIQKYVVVEVKAEEAKGRRVNKKAEKGEDEDAIKI